VAGFVSAVVSQPFDIAKTRIQVAPAAYPVPRIVGCMVSAARCLQHEVGCMLSVA
jgi:hypothetical protein